jgi:2-dehydro-3-deoxyphosphooctonate aldolase (KDO 8-P synthase)
MKPWIVGPCAMENEETFFQTGEALIKIMAGKNWYLKASFDKANRTSTKGGRGIGLHEAKEIWVKFKAKHPDIKFCTDIHERHQVNHLEGLIDIIQIPAFLCRQTDLLVSAGRTAKIVNVKKGQWITPDQTKYFAEKVKSKSPDTECWITERGTAFGSNPLLVDFGAAKEMAGYCDHLILDCTHATQRKKGDTTGGDRELAEKYMMASLFYEYTGLFIETHPNPPSAVSDADCQIYLNRMEKLVNFYGEIEELCQKRQIL